MRPDLKKVICEKERKGDRSYMGGTKGYEKEFQYRNREDRDEDFAALDCLPTHESMTRRLTSYGTRSFSENLGALRGLIVKNVGKNWDKLYSAICAQVSPTGTNIERHVHQHLPDFIETKTRMGERGVEIHGYGDTPRFNGAGKHWVPIASISYSRADYYVHPVTRCITKFKKQRSWKQRYRRSLPETTRVDLDEVHQLHKIKGLWWIVTLAAIPKHAYKKETHKVEYGDMKLTYYRVVEYIELPARDVLASGDSADRYTEHQLKEAYGRAGVYGVRKTSASHKALKSAGLAA